MNHSRHRVAGSVVAVLCGTLIALQTRINGELGHRLGDGYLAALISFAGGLVVISLVVLTGRAHRDGVRTVVAAVRQGHQPWWVLGGGICGAALVLAQGITVATLGAALFTVAVVAGQTGSGLVVDRAGLGPASAMRLTVPRVLGAALTAVAVVVAVSDRLAAGSLSWLLVLPLVAGLGLSFQSAVNGRVRVLGTVSVAAFGNFVVGTATLAVAFVVHGLVTGWPTRFPSEPWLYLGGLIGLLYISVNAALVRYTGVLLLSLAAIAGQLAGALVLDTVFPVEGSGPSVVTVVGVALTLLAVSLTLVRPRRGVVVS